MKQVPMFVLIFFVALQIFAGVNGGPITQNLLPNKTRNERDTPPSSSKENSQIVVKVAVVCDLECVRVFHNDRAKLVEYLTSLFVGMDRRFEDVRNHNISFKVTSITMIESSEQQRFVEEARGKGGELVGRVALNMFSTWMYEKQTTLPDFTVALALVGAPMSNLRDAGGVSIISSTCAVDHNRKGMGGAIVMSTSSMDPSTTAFRLMAQLFGSEEHFFKSTCNLLQLQLNCTTSLEGYVMSPLNLNGDPNDLATALSEVDQFLSSEKAHCLRSSGNDTVVLNPIIDTATTTLFHLSSGVSIEQQCRVYRNKPTINLESASSNNCELNGCKELLPGNWRPNIPNMNKFEILDGTPCADNGRCFRGQCLRLGTQAVSVSSHLCLGISTNGTNHLQLVPCSIGASWSNLVHLRNSPGHPSETVETNKQLLVFSYPNSTNVSLDHCLMAVQQDIEEVTLTVVKCSTINSTTVSAFQWQLILTGSGDSAVFYHPLTKRCIARLENSSYLTSTTSCDEFRKQALWRFVPKSDQDIHHSVNTNINSNDKKFTGATNHIEDDEDDQDDDDDEDDEDDDDNEGETLPEILTNRNGVRPSKIVTSPPTTQPTKPTQPTQPSQPEEFQTSTLFKILAANAIALAAVFPVMLCLCCIMCCCCKSTSRVV